jgi:serine/threonine-protein kinase
MELVEGPNLADLLARGPLPIASVLRIARQVAEALEAAHSQGIVHRDLKPANIKVRADGEVKVLDFGLAKALQNSEPSDLGDVSSTVTRPLTADGAIVGTGPYMSPEQARGAVVDPRSDLWALGVVLWEMLTGKQLFKGPTLSDSIAAVLTAEPDWSVLPAQTPAAIRRLLRRCLQKERTQRLDSAFVARLDIDEALGGQTESPPPPARARLAWIGAAGLGVVALAMAAAALLGPRATAPTVRMRADLGADLMLRKDLASAVIISPDGRTLVYATEAGAVPAQLYSRRLDQLHAAPMRGTENAVAPFFSPDGQWIGFFDGPLLKKIAIGSGTPVTVCETPGVRGGGAWGSDDVIYFSAVTDKVPLIMKVPAAGGTPQSLTTLRPGEITHRWPQVLPGNRAILYTSNTSSNWDDANVIVQPLPEGPSRVVQAGFFGRYVRSGHLLYVKAGTLYAAPFDVNRLEVTGPSGVIAERVVTDPTTGAGHFDVSNDGTLVYLEGLELTAARPTVWMERGGNTVTLRAEADNWANPFFFADGTQLAVDVSDGKQIDIWLQLFDTPKFTRLTFEGADDYKPVPTPDGQRVVFTSTRNGAPNLYWQRVDGAGEVQRLTTSTNAQAATSWHPSGRLLAFHEATPQTGLDILLLSLRSRGDQWTTDTPRPFAGGRFNESEGRFSPDGRWLAYTSNETGRAEIFVRALEGGGKWQVSTSGGRDAAWSGTRQELLYFSTSDNRIMVAPYSVTDQSFHSGGARPWAVTAVGRPARNARTFDLHPDGERVAVVPPEVRDTDHVNLVLGLFEELRGAPRTRR